jgi:hypothetical protein
MGAMLFADAGAGAAEKSKPINKSEQTQVSRVKFTRQITAIQKIKDLTN